MRPGRLRDVSVPIRFLVAQVGVNVILGQAFSVANPNLNLKFCDLDGHDISIY